MRQFLVGLLIFLFTAPALAQGLERPWWDRSKEAKVGAYWIKTDLPADQANELARHLNVMYDEYSKRLASLPQRAPDALHVLIFKDRRDYELTLRARFGVDPAGTGGLFFISSRGNGLAFWTGGLSQRRIHHVLQHEGFHQFAYSRFGHDLPIWANEGLAEFFGEAVVVDRKLVIGQSRTRIISDVKDAIEDEEYIPFDDMLSMSSDRWGAALRNGTARLQYHQAWSMVHFLVYGDEGRYVGAFERYLRLINHGVESREAFVRAFGAEDIDAFEARWKSYATQALPSAFVTAMERMEFMAEGLRALRERDVHPESIEGLKQALREHGFTYTLARHGHNETLTAEDDEMFEIPIDERAGEARAIFVLHPQDIHRMNRRERNLEKSDPTPATIATENLMPRQLEVQWVRGEDGGFSYEIVAE